MYPVDSIKVRIGDLGSHTSNILTVIIDPHTNIERNQAAKDHLQCTMGTWIMERNVQCRRRRWYV